MSKKDEFYVYFIVPGKAEKKLWVSDIVQGGRAILSNADFEEAMMFETPDEFRNHLKNFSPPFNAHAYSIIKRKGKKEELVPLFAPAGTKAGQLRKGNLAAASQANANAVKQGSKKGAVSDILKLAAEGKSRKDIIALGFNKNTVNRQVGEWLKKQSK